MHLNYNIRLKFEEYIVLLWHSFFFSIWTFISTMHDRYDYVICILWDWKHVPVWRVYNSFGDKQPKTATISSTVTNSITANHQLFLHNWIKPGGYGQFCWCSSLFILWLKSILILWTRAGNFEIWNVFRENARHAHIISIIVYFTVKWVNSNHWFVSSNSRGQIAADFKVVNISSVAKPVGSWYSLISECGFENPRSWSWVKVTYRHFKTHLFSGNC